VKYGIREICNVVLKAKTKLQFGSLIFYPGEPVLFFDTLKTSDLNKESSTVYATGGRGSTRIISWDGDNVITFNMQDALLSERSIALLTKAQIIENDNFTPIYTHKKENVIIGANNKITLKHTPIIDENNKYFIYVMKSDENDNIISIPYHYTNEHSSNPKIIEASDEYHSYIIPSNDNAIFYEATELITGKYAIVDYYTQDLGTYGKTIVIP